MGKGLNDYLVNIQSGVVVTLDFEKLRKISDEEFRKVHVEENEKYLANHEKLIGHKPSCEYCDGQIEKPEELMREHGISSHVYCFRQLYGNEVREKLSEREQEYFDRIIRILG